MPARRSPARIRSADAGQHFEERAAFELSEDSIDEAGDLVIKSRPRPRMDPIVEEGRDFPLPGVPAAKPIRSRPSAKSVIEMSELSIDEVEGEVVIHPSGKRRASVGDGSSAPRPLSACAMLWTAIRFAADVSARTGPAGSGGLSSFHALVLPLIVLWSVLLPGRVPGLAPSAALMARGLSRAMREPASAGRSLSFLLDLALLLGIGAAVARRIGSAKSGARTVGYDWRRLVSIPGREEETTVLATATGLSAAGCACGTALALIRPI
jgi:hypothetical protein